MKIIEAKKRFTLLISELAILMSCGMQCHAQIDPKNNMQNDLNMDESGVFSGYEISGNANTEGLKDLVPNNTSQQNIPGTSITPGQAAEENANAGTKEAHRQVDNNKYDNSKDVQTTGNPTQQSYQPKREKVKSNCSAKIADSEYDQFADDYIMEPYKFEEKYIFLCNKYGYNTNDKVDYLNFKNKLKSKILDKIKTIRSDYAYIEQFDIPELESGKYNNNDAPYGWKQVQFLSPEGHSKLKTKYHFDFHVFQNKNNPQIFVVSLHPQDYYINVDTWKGKVMRKKTQDILMHINNNIHNYAKKQNTPKINIYLTYAGNYNHIFNSYGKQLISYYNSTSNLKDINDLTYSNKSQIYAGCELMKQYGFRNIFLFRKHIDKVENALLHDK